MGRGPMQQPTKAELRQALADAERRAQAAERNAAVSDGKAEVLQETIVKIATEGAASEAPVRHLRSVSE